MAGTAYINMRTAGSGVAEFLYRRIDQGELQGLSLIPITSSIPWASVFCIAGIMRGGEGARFISNIFFEDYVSANHYPAWLGKYDFMTQDVLFLQVITDAIYDIRLVATVYREEDQ